MTKKNINQDWRTDFNWMDPEDVQLDVIRKNTEVEEGELGPDNKEARTLMFAMVQGIELKEKNIDLDKEEFWEDQGIGKDLFGKYAFTEFRHKDKTYLVQVREKSAYDNASKITRGRVIGPRITLNRKGMN
jgi:hypothetical protein